jgi:hypothetical protein
MLKKNSLIFLIIWFSICIIVYIGNLLAVPIAFLLTIIAISSEFGFKIVQGLVSTVNKIESVGYLMVDPSYRELWLPLIIAAISVVPAIIAIWYELHEIRKKL